MSSLGRNLLAVRRGSLVLLVQAKTDATMAEWTEFLDLTSAAMAEHGGKCRVLVFTAGGKPDAAQRALSLERGWRNNESSPVVVVSDDALARGVITVFAWFGMNIHAVKPNRVTDAFDLLDLTFDERTWILAERRTLEDKLASSPG